MSSHLASPRLLAPLALVLATGAALFAGCGDGRQDAEVFVPRATNVAQAAPVAAPPVIASSSQPAAPVVLSTEAQPTTTTPQDAATTAERRAERARRDLREERAAAARARERAAAREDALRTRLAAARAEARAERQRQESQKPAADAPIAASDVSEASPLERNQRSQAEARAAVVRFHELLDQRDAAACEILTPRLLREIYGTDGDPAERCRGAVAAIAGQVTVTIVSSTADGRHASADVVSRMGDSEIRQALRLILVDGTWLIDAVVREPAA